jgi:DNA primase
MKNSSVDKKLDFLTSIVNNYKLEKDNLNLCIWCPFCRNSNKDKLKLVIHLQKNFYHCWICDKSGSNISQLVYKINKSKVSKAKELFYNNKSRFSLFEEDQEEVNLNVSIPKGFGLLNLDFNSRNPDIRDVFRYAIKRGTSKHKMHLLKLGYSLDREFKRSLIIPSIDKNGELNFYTSRRIDVGSDFSFKYNNAKIPRKYIIFNEINIDWSLPLTLVEGPLDLLKTNDNSTCLLGSSLTEDMKLFHEIVKNKTEVILALDKDAYNKTVKIGKLLSSYDINVKIADTRKYEDIGEMPSEYVEKIISEAKEFNQEDELLNKIKNLF